MSLARLAVRRACNPPRPAPAKREVASRTGGTDVGSRPRPDLPSTSLNHPRLRRRRVSRRESRAREDTPADGELERWLAVGWPLFHLRFTLASNGIVESALPVKVLDPRRAHDPEDLGLGVVGFGRSAAIQLQLTPEAGPGLPDLAREGARDPVWVSVDDGPGVGGWSVPGWAWGVLGGIAVVAAGAALGAALGQSEERRVVGPVVVSF